MKHKWLILGGSGFIGSHLANMLLKYGSKVHIIDNCHVSEVRHRFVTDSGRFNYTFDLMNSESLRRGLEDADFIVNLASVVGVTNVLDNPTETIVGSLELALEIHALNVKLNKPMFFASTSEVYGYECTDSFKESDVTRINSSDCIRTSYSAMKRTLESLFINAPYPTVIGRFFNVTGPGQDPNKAVLPNMISRGFETGVITVHNEGKQVRSLCHIKTAIKSIVNLLTNATAHNRLFNIGDEDNVITMLELATYVKDNLTKRGYTPVEIAHEDNESADYVMKRKPSTDRLKSVIGNVGHFSIPEIIDDIIDYSIEVQDYNLVHG